MSKQILIVLGILLVFGCADVSKENQLQTGCSGDSESTPENVYVPPAPAPTPTDTNTEPYPVSIHTGNVNYTCALISDGKIKCWGRNRSGQLGDGTTTTRLTPITVPGINNASSISLGEENVCALLADKTVKCWGINTRGRLGDGTTTTRLTPVTVSGIDDAIDISVGASHSCALLANRTIQCWGYGEKGQLGDGTTTDRLTPVTVSGIDDALSVSAGTWHTCALIFGGKIKCWGSNGFGELGFGTSINESLDPVEVSGITNGLSLPNKFQAVRTCAILLDNSLKCWGWNVNYELGDNTKTNRYTPITPIGVTTASKVTLGSHNTMIISNGNIYHWGYNSIPTKRSLFSEISSAVDITTTSHHSCVLLSDKTVKCWGDNEYGQLGDGTTTNRSTPVTVQF